MTTLTLILALLLVACTGAEQASRQVEATAAPEPAEAAADDTTAGEPVSLATPDEHKVIRRASLSIEAEDTRSVYQEIRRLVGAAGGFVQSASIADPEDTQDQPRVDLVLRIPTGELDRALDRIGELATRVVSQSESGEDVTEEYFDLEARIENLTVLENELRELLADVRQNGDADPQKLLQVFNEISRVRGEIEQLEGRRQMLDDLASLATVSVEITPTPELTPVVADGWTPLAVARQSIQDLVAALQGLADVTIRVGLFLLPLVLVGAVPLFLLWRLARRFTFSRDIPGA